MALGLIEPSGFAAMEERVYEDEAEHEHVSYRGP